MLHRRLRPQPPTAVAVRQEHARRRRPVDRSRVLQPAVEDDRVTASGEHFERAVGRCIRRDIGTAAPVTGGTDREVAHARPRQVGEEVPTFIETRGCGVVSRPMFMRLLSWRRRAHPAVPPAGAGVTSNCVWNSWMCRPRMPEHLGEGRRTVDAREPLAAARDEIVQVEDVVLADVGCARNSRSSLYALARSDSTTESERASRTMR